MKRSILLVSALALCAIAYSSEFPIGALSSADGGSVNNFSNGQWGDGGVAATFSVAHEPSLATLSVQCNLAACVLATSAGDAGTASCNLGQTNSGVALPSGSPLFDIAVDKTITSIAMVPAAVNPDGGVVACQIFKSVLGFNPVP